MQLQSSSNHERELINNASDGMIEATLEGKIVTVNFAAEQLLQRPRKDLIGKSFDTLVAEEDRQRLHERSANLYNPGAVDVSEWKLIRGDGSLVDVEISAKMYFGNMICGIFRDVSARKRHDRQLEFLDQLSNKMSRTRDFHRRIEIATELLVPQFADLVVVSMIEEDRVYFRSMKSLKEVDLKIIEDSKLRESAEHKIPLPLNKSLLAGEPLLITDFASEIAMFPELNHYSSQFKDLSVKSGLILPMHADKKIVGLVSLFHQSRFRKFTETEIPFLREVASRLAVFIENAHLAFQVKTEMHAREHVLSIISHDLKNPLANIDLAIQILDSSRPITEASANRAIARIQNSLKSAERLIADLLDFGKIHSGHLSMKFDAVSVESIVTTAIDTFELRCAQKNLKIQSLSEFDLPAVRCDLSRIHQVMWNLIGNSIKFTPSGGEIFISAKCIDGAVQFTVADNGKGIDPVEIDKIFDRFWQSKESWEVGYGLGLSIAKGIIIAHGGKIWAEVRSEGGTKIHFTLPIHPYSKSERSNAELSQKLLQTKQKVEQSSKILDGIVVFAVDDSPEVLGLLKIFFERAGAKYYCAESVYNAVEMVRTLEPDVVLSDIEMNGANGYDFLSCIRQMGNPKVCQIPVIAMTAHSEESELGKIANAGFQFVASKPFSAEQLIKDISALPLRRRKN